MPEQFGFKSTVSHEAANSWLPPLPRTNDESPSPFFYPDGQYDISLVYPPAVQYPAQVPSLLFSSSAAVSGGGGSYDYSYRPPASYGGQSYTFGENGTMLEEATPAPVPVQLEGYMRESEWGQYFDFDSLPSQA